MLFEKGGHMNNILVVAAHPDDEVLGCGGTIAKLAKEGHSIFTLILGEGVTSRNISKIKGKKEMKILQKSTVKANKLLGVKKVFFHNFPDNKFDSVPLLEIVKDVEEIKNQIRPKIIFTHYEKDLNIDHRITYQAVITATRPVINETVKEIYSFEVLSSTEWAYPISFSPDIFYDISKTINDKLVALLSYKSELRGSCHPRSLSGIRNNAKFWGQKVGLGYAEAFKCVRIIKGDK